jgi:hypothetical protein
LRQLEELKQNKIPEIALPVSIDVVGLYTNIPNKEGLEWFKRALKKERTRQSHQNSPENC